VLCEFAQWGPGRSYGKLRFWCISGLEKSRIVDDSQLVGRFQLSELCKNFISQSPGVHRPFQHRLNDVSAARDATPARCLLSSV